MMHFTYTIINSLERRVKEVGPKDRRKRCKNDTSSDIAVRLKPDQGIFFVGCRKDKKQDVSQTSIFLVVDEQSRIRVHMYG